MRHHLLPSILIYQETSGNLLPNNSKENIYFGYFFDFGWNGDKLALIWSHVTSSNIHSLLAQLVSTNSWGNYLALELLNVQICSPPSWYYLCVDQVIHSSCLLWLKTMLMRAMRANQRRRVEISWAESSYKVPLSWKELQIQVTMLCVIIW